MSTIISVTLTLASGHSSIRPMQAELLLDSAFDFFELRTLLIENIPDEAFVDLVDLAEDNFNVESSVASLSEIISSHNFDAVSEIHLDAKDEEDNNLGKIVITQKELFEI